MMLTQNYKPMSVIYNCKICDYSCSDKSNFNKHLNTKKHKTTANTTANNTTKTTTENTCKCGKKYRHSASLSRHKSTCKKNESECYNSKESIILELIAQNKELMTLLSCQQQQHKEETKCLFETIQEQSANMQQTIKEIIPSIGNNNTTNNNNNQFNLQVFLNEDCKDAINFSDFIKQIQVSFEDIENQAECGYVKGISKLFIENLKELGTHKRPIHCTDKKRKTLYIKENNEWDKEGSQDILLKGIQEVTRSTMKTLINEKVIQAEEFADMESDFSKKCLVIQRNLIPTAPRETAFSKVMENITKNSGIL